jgi:hypothetical protein
VNHSSTTVICADLRTVKSLDLPPVDGELIFTTKRARCLNFLGVLRAGHGDYIVNDEALAYMRERALAGHVIGRLGGHPDRCFADQAALRGGGDEGGEVCVADLGAEAVLRLVARPGVVHRDPGAAREPGPQPPIERSVSPRPSPMILLSHGRFGSVVSACSRRT